ncbi:MAG: DUF4037 domain-containing protein [Anaerolineae bacterium]|nr:DUF4037 domain-containing protein [Anaerolineae bacterium]
MSVMDLPFVPGLELSKLLFVEGVRPVMAAHFSALAYSAARIDFGSDVLGFDTPQSRDHGWGPKLTLFVAEENWAQCQAIIDALGHCLPLTVGGYSTHFTDEGMESIPIEAIQRPIRHGVRVTTVARFFTDYVGFDPTLSIDEIDWLLAPPQRLRTIASGRVFHDGLGALDRARRALCWYPRDVWLYLMANAWRRIDQEEPFMARCGDVGDELGSRLIVARQIDELMCLCFLIERQYWPYNKWFGTAFSRLVCAGNLMPVFQRVLDSPNWHEREKHLSGAYLIVGEMHNALCLTPYIEPEIVPFYTRPYQVPHAARFCDALHAEIASKTVQSWPRDIGSVGQWANSTDVLEHIPLCQALGVIYKNGAGA